MVLLSKYLLGAYEFSEDEAFRADYDGDGTVDTFDLISLRQSYIRNAMNMPKGTWVGEGFNGTRYFWFDENDEGTVVRNNGETIIPFSFDKSGTLIMFTLSSGKLATASIAWIDEAHFYLDWGSTNPELFTYKSDSRFDKGPYLKGEYVSDAGFLRLKHDENIVITD